LSIRLRGTSKNLTSSKLSVVDKDIPRFERSQSLLEAGAVTRSPEPPILKNLCDPRQTQRIKLQGRGLIVRRNTRISNGSHTRILRQIFATRNPLIFKGLTFVSKTVVFTTINTKKTGISGIVMTLNFYLPHIV